MAMTLKPIRRVVTGNDAQGRSRVKDAEVRKRMADFGFEPIGNTPEEFGAFVKEDIARWAKLVKETGAKVE